MSILVVGSVALDSVKTPAGGADRVVGGSATFFSSASSLFTGVRVVGVVGDDYPLEQLSFLEDRGADLSGLARSAGESFFWAGRYQEGCWTRETLATRPGVFASFDPVIPPAFRDSETVFLGNIDPVLQLGVLDQVRAPGLVAADTMNFWIERARDTLMEVLVRLDILFVNDEEAALLAGEADLARAVRWLLDRGPRLVVVKQGDRGATLFGDGRMFSAPAYPVPVVVDPTGAGDAFAGGFLGYLAARGPGRTASLCVASRTDSGRSADLRRALVYGSVMGSYAVEAFSVDRLRNLDRSEARERADALADFAECV